MKQKAIYICVLLILLTGVMSGCQKADSATANRKMENASEEDEITIEEAVTTNEDEQITVEETKTIQEENEGTADEITFADEMQSTPIQKLGYDVDLASDIKNYDGKVDIIVGDNYYTTQINDWYVNFDQYEGKVVQIEGFYINDFWPYTFVGRYGPVCQYCNGGYVSFEFYTDEKDVSDLQTLEDWLRVTGILRKGQDKNGIFYYIETLKMEVMDSPGLETVTN